MIRILVLLLALPFLISVAPPPRALPPARVHVPQTHPVVIRIAQPVPRSVGAIVHRPSSIIQPSHQPAPPCDRTNAVAVLRTFVYGDVHGMQLAIGSAEAWSCVSVAEAQAQLDQQTAQVAGQAAAWYGSGGGHAAP